ncbi:aminotransferase class V-fold PLP-dependent enzyme [Natroniella acetigena]|uniref:aminotransferase class V-fold PLP-dependent enzyme n=1 Tax=Natroniella acetigena TaxID=52004 RepID=UPI0024A91613|nr:aminotransferase class V-fold PLP-dependent enzyme [Natroniella acetigena]
MGGDIIYLDNAATSYPKPESVYQAMNNYLRDAGVSPGRGSYNRAEEAEKIVEMTRSLLGQLFNIEQAKQIIFTSNVTEALNLALKGLIEEGDHIITSQMEHNAMWRPLKALEEKRDIDLTVISCPEGKPLSAKDLEEAITI